MRGNKHSKFTHCSLSELPKIRRTGNFQADHNRFPLYFAQSGERLPAPNIKAAILCPVGERQQAFLHSLIAGYRSFPPVRPTISHVRLLGRPRGDL